MIAKARENAIGIVGRIEEKISVKASPRRQRRRGLKEIQDFSQDWTIAQYHIGGQTRAEMRHGSLPSGETERTPVRRSAVGRSRLKTRGFAREIETRDKKLARGGLTPDRLADHGEIVDVRTLPLLKDGTKTLNPESLRKAHIEHVQDITIRSSPPRNDDTDSSSVRDFALY